MTGLKETLNVGGWA